MSPWLFWLLLAVALMIAETVTPAFVMFFFGLGAMAASLAAAIQPQSHAAQTLVFAVASVVFLAVLRRRVQRVFLGRASDTEKSLYDLAMGQSGQALTVIAPGTPGRVSYSGTIWQARSADCIEAGQAVVIVGRDEVNKLILIVGRDPKAGPGGGATC